jgi:integrase
MGKRANGEGSIYKRKDGRYCATLTIEGDKRKSFYGATRQEVSRKLNDALKSHREGLPLADEQQTVGRFFDAWLEAVKPKVRHSTHYRYSGYVRIHIAPELGRVRLAKLTPEHLQRLYAHRIEAGLSPMSVKHIHRVIHAALEKAVRWSLVPRNVADLVDPPRTRRKDMATLSAAQARILISAAQGERLEALYVVALTTGMRQGELLALRWGDVDLDRRTLQVRSSLQRAVEGFEFAEPKTASSRRSVSITEAAASALRRHRAAQASERLRVGAAWADLGLVFANKVGEPLDPRNLLQRCFYPLLKRAGLPRIRFHDLRHTAATLMLAQGVHPKIASEMLGHSNIGITLDTYSHVTPTMQRSATDALDALLSGG